MRLLSRIASILFLCSLSFAQFYPSVAGNPTDNSKAFYAVGGGSAQAQTASYNPAVKSLNAGLFLSFKPSVNNTGAGPTLSVNGLTGVTVKKCGAGALLANDLVSGTVALLFYDGTAFQLINPQNTVCGAANAQTTQWNLITNPSLAQSLTFGTNTTLFTFGDYGASPTDIFKFTDSSTTSSDISYNLVVDTGAGSFHNPVAFRINGANQFQVCRQPGPQGEVVFGSAVACTSISQAPFAKVIFQSQTASHNVVRIFQGSTSATSTMLEMNNATAAGTGFNFISFSTGCTAADTSCTGGTQVASINGNGLFNGSASLSALTLNTITGSTQCLQVNSSGVVSGSGSGCGGTGSGTITSSTAGQIPWFAATGTTVVGNANLTVDSGGNLVSAGTITASQVITTGPFFVTTPWPAGAVTVGSASQTQLAVDNDGSFKISENADGPFSAARIVAQGTQALGTTAIASGTCSTEATITVASLTTSDRVGWNFNGDVTGVTGYTSATAGALRVDVYPKSGAIGIKQCNQTASSITPGAATIVYQVLRK